MEGPRTDWSVRATREAGGAGWRIGALYPQRKVRTAWTEARRGAGNLGLGLVLVLIGDHGRGGVEVRYQDWSSISKRRSGGIGRGMAMAIQLKRLEKAIENMEPRESNR